MCFENAGGEVSCSGIVRGCPGPGGGKEAVIGWQCVEREWSDPLRWWAEWERHPWTPNVAPLEWPSVSSVGIGDHMYTTYYAEQADAVARNGYRNEGIAARVFPDSQHSFSVPLFHLLNASGDHFYTVS